MNAKGTLRINIATTKPMLSCSLGSPQISNATDVWSQKACMIWLLPQNTIMLSLMLVMPGKMWATTQQRMVRPVIAWFVINTEYLSREKEKEEKHKCRF